jgi:hypothetical protein
MGDLISISPVAAGWDVIAGGAVGEAAVDGIDMVVADVGSSY